MPFEITSLKNFDFLYTLTSEAYPELSRTSEMELFAKVVNDWKPLTIFAKSSIIDVRLVFEYTPESQQAAKFKVDNKEDR